MSSKDGYLTPGHKRGGAPVGNQNARKYGRWKRALDVALAEYEDTGLGIVKGGALEAMAKQCVKDAFNADPLVRKDARTEIANRLDGKPKETIDATFTHALASELTDDELLAIARGEEGSGDGAAEATPSATDPSAVH